MAEPSWLFDAAYPADAVDPPRNVVAQVESVIAKLTELAQAAEATSGMQVLEEAPGLHEGSVNEQAALALTYEAAATWLWGQLWGGPDRNALFDIMSN